MESGPFKTSLNHFIFAQFLYVIRDRVRLLVFGLVIFCIGCAEVPEKNELLGKWDVVNAHRNGRPTLTLTDAFFDFQNDSVLVTNILRVEESFPYAKEGEMVHQGGRMPISYKLEESLGDSIILSAKINAFTFHFFLKRSLTVDSLSEPE